MGLTLDTGALMALERRATRVRSLIASADNRGELITVPAPVLVEWWRQPPHHMRALIGGFLVEPLTERLARLAGAAHAAMSRPSVTDAVVMASAALRGDTVLTSDYDDLAQLQAHFPGVTLLAV